MCFEGNERTSVVPSDVVEGVGVWGVVGGCSWCCCWSELRRAFTSHSFTVRSEEPEARRVPSMLKSRLCTAFAWPVRRPSRREVDRSQMCIVLLSKDYVNK